MLSKCANPACDAKFQYLHAGRVYVVRYRASTHHNAIQAGLDFSEELDRIEHVWLCAVCCRSMTIKAYGAGEIRVVAAQMNRNGFE